VTRTFGIPLGAVEHGCVTPVPGDGRTCSPARGRPSATLATWASTRAWIGLVFRDPPQASRLPTCSTEPAGRAGGGRLRDVWQHQEGVAELDRAEMRVTSGRWCQLYECPAFSISRAIALRRRSTGGIPA